MRKHIHYVRSVLTDVKADRAPRAFKSESVPDQPAAQPSAVRKVVMASFAAEVESATHSVLLTVHTETNTKRLSLCSRGWPRCLPSWWI